MVSKAISFCLMLFIWQLSFGQNVGVGSSLFADFDGDYSREYAFVVQTKQPTIDSLGKVSGGEYKVIFSVGSLGEIEIGCCELKLVLEGDLTNDGSTELSVYKTTGSTQTLTTYSYVNSHWQIIIPVFTLAESSTPLTESEIQNSVYSENGEIYY